MAAGGCSFRGVPALICMEDFYESKNNRTGAEKEDSYGVRLLHNIKSHPLLYLMILPVILYYLVYHYYPMYGLSIAFYDYVPIKGIRGSEFVGLENFKAFITDPYFFRTMRNTLTINVLLLIFGFPFPILFAVLLNELNSSKLRKVTQTITYMPHFISTVIICGLMLDFCGEKGVLTSIICGITGMEHVNLFSKSAWFQPLYVLMSIWQEFGWDSIIYYAALTGIDQELYEAAEIDGANRWEKFGILQSRAFPRQS